MNVEISETVFQWKVKKPKCSGSRIVAWYGSHIGLSG